MARREVRVMYRGVWFTDDPCSSLAWTAYPVRVEIEDTCPECGGPRGEPIEHHFHEDGECFTVDRWINPCGHVDAYSSVLVEANHPLAQPDRDDGTEEVEA